MARQGKLWASALTSFALLVLSAVPGLAVGGPANTPSYTANDMVLIVDIVQSNTDVEMPINGNVSGISVDWGDGTSTTGINSAGNQLHTYASPGTYYVVISGTTMSWFGTISGYVGAARITEVVQWGNLGMDNLHRAFFYATNLLRVPSDLPSTVKDPGEMFMNALLFNDEIRG